MNVIKTAISDVIIIEPKVFGDSRGFFFESYNQRQFEQLTGSSPVFVQDNHSRSARGVLRGLHFQEGDYAQAKLVRVLHGEVLDVVVDLRPNSPTFGKHHKTILSEANKKQFFIPRGFAHGFVVLSESAVFAYKVDNVYSKAHEGGILYNDPALGIDWQINTSEILLSEKDAVLPTLEAWSNHSKM